MKLTNQQLKQIIREELQNVLSEGSMSDAKKSIEQEVDASSHWRRNKYLKGFMSLKYVSGNPPEDYVSWVRNAEQAMEEGSNEASEAYYLVKKHMKKVGA
jgi:hypothetical protein